MTIYFIARLAAAWLMISQEVYAVNSDGLASAHECAGCHGTEGGGYGSLPPISGMDRHMFVEAMRGFKQGDRPATVMTRIARGLTERELEQLADHFSKIP